MSMRLIKLLPVAACLALSGVAAASIPKDLPSVVVKYGDLSLNTKTGVASLHARIECGQVRVQLARQPRPRPARTVRAVRVGCVEAERRGGRKRRFDPLSPFCRCGRFGGRDGLVASN